MPLPSLDAAGFSVWHSSSPRPSCPQTRSAASSTASRPLASTLGTAKKFITTVAFILLGLDAQSVDDVAPGRQPYSYKKLDLSNEGDKPFFEATLAHGLEINGKKWADG
ncbi:hypothetical protein C0992_002059 [Termitomyces sp. T32_za158]|nr:hypothetical protein C0992_002059 [Termitomyces sp. T32_za158]